MVSRISSINSIFVEIVGKPPSPVRDWRQTFGSRVLWWRISGERNRTEHRTRWNAENRKSWQIGSRASIVKSRNPFFWGGAQPLSTEWKQSLNFFPIFLKRLLEVDWTPELLQFFLTSLQTFMEEIWPKPRIFIIYTHIIIHITYYIFLI